MSVNVILVAQIIPKFPISTRIVASCGKLDTATVLKNANTKKGSHITTIKPARTKIPGAYLEHFGGSFPLGAG